METGVAEKHTGYGGGVRLIPILSYVSTDHRR